MSAPLPRSKLLLAVKMSLLYGGCFGVFMWATGTWREGLLLGTCCGLIFGFGKTYLG